MPLFAFAQVNRSCRRLLRGMIFVAIGLGIFAVAAPSLASNEPWQRLDATRQLLGDATPRTQGLELDLPHVSEDGSAVPLTVRFTAELGEGDYIERIDLFANGNPYPEIATFHLTPLSGKAEISTRVRLNETQQVIAVATSQQGEHFVTAREVRITVSGCLVRSGGTTPEALSNPRVNLPTEMNPGEPAEVRTLINHPMETGLREGDNSELLPRHIIERFHVSLGGETAFEAELHQSVSANPYLRFYLAPQTSGEAQFSWQDDNGNTARHAAELNVS